MFHSLSFRCAYLSIIAFAVSVGARGNGFSYTVDGIDYFVPQQTIGYVPAPTDALFDETIRNGVLPITVISTNRTLSASAISRHVLKFKTTDDVYQEGFSNVMIIQFTGKTPVNTTNTIVVTAKDVNVTTFNGGSSTIASGPYFRDALGGLHHALRLYSDVQGAFTETVYQLPNGTFSVLPANLPGQALAVGVPSRLLFEESAEKPLAGVRVGIKDIFDIAGIKTGNGNRAWYHLYPPAEKTAEVVQRLVDAGAIIVGKVKTSQFANGETATADWVDYHSPFNPRGDGYQDASSSSSGPGAAQGAYEWLDLNLGSDTGGSIRGPAQVQGIFGNRPTHGLVPLTGVMPMCPELDTAGFLARDPFIWSTAAKVMYGTAMKPNTSIKYPKKIKLISFPKYLTDEQDILRDGFLKKLSAWMRVDPSAIKDVDVEDMWHANRPANSTWDLKIYLNHTYPTLITKNQIKRIRNPFYADYAKLHDGRHPFIDPVPRIRWLYGDTTNRTLIDEMSKKAAFSNWVNAGLLKSDPVTCSESLVIYIESDSWIYRDTYKASARVPFGFYTAQISIYSGAPDFVIPIGQERYFSRITNHSEYRPATINFMAARGCDAMLFSLIKDLVTAGLLSIPKSGGSNVDGGAILSRRSIDDAVGVDDVGVDVDDVDVRMWR